MLVEELECEALQHVSAWLTKCGLDSSKLLPQLDDMGIENLKDLVLLRPDEIETLDIPLGQKHKLVTAIDTDLDLPAWLSEWGLESLTSELDELGIEEPDHLLDLSLDEIEALPTNQASKLQLAKAISHLDSEVSALVERQMLLARKRHAVDSAAMPPPPPRFSPRPAADHPKQAAGSFLSPSSSVGRPPLSPLRPVQRLQLKCQREFGVKHTIEKRERRTTPPASSVRGGGKLRHLSVKAFECPF